MVKVEKFKGYGSFKTLLEHINTRHKSLFLVTGKTSFKACGAEDMLAKDFPNLTVARFCDFSPNPRFEDALIGAEKFKAAKADAILAIGGGSVMDMAKLINAAAHNAESFKDCVIKGNKPQDSGVALYYAPTTAGSGSEATQFAVVYIGVDKYSLVSPHFYPAALCLDAELNQSMPKSLRAETGFDALSQAIESYWAVGATHESRKFSQAAMERIVPNLVESVTSPNLTNIEAMVAMVDGAHLAGQAIDTSRTTIAHALSYHVTKTYDVPHGHAVALFLGCFLLEHEKPTGLSDIMAKIYENLGCKNGREAKAKWYDMMQACGLETDLGKIGINKDTIDALIDSVNLERLKNNPVQFGKEELREILGI